MDKNKLLEFEELNELIKLFETAQSREELVNLKEKEFERIIHYYLQNNHAQKALDASEMALKLYPYSSEFCLSKADAHIELGELEEAEDYLVNNFKIDKSNIDFYVILSEVYILRNNYDKALDICYEGIKHCNNNLDSLYLHLAEIIDHQGDYKKVVALLENAIQINPKNEDALYLYSITMTILDKSQEKVEYLQRLRDDDPFNEEVWYYLAISYRELALYEKAIEALEYLGAINESLSIESDKAQIYFDANEYENAIQCLKELDKEGALEASDYIIFAKSYKELGNLYRAKTYFKEALSIDESSDEIYFELASIYYSEKKFEASLPLIDRALERNKDLAQYQELKADILIGLGKLDEACLIYKDIVQLNSSTSYYLSKFAYVTAIQFGLDEAIELLDQGLEDFEHDVLHFHKAILYFIFENEEKGFSEFAKGLELDFESHTIVFDKLPELESNEKIQSMLSLFRE